MLRKQCDPMSSSHARPASVLQTRASQQELLLWHFAPKVRGGFFRRPVHLRDECWGNKCCLAGYEKAGKLLFFLHHWVAHLGDHSGAQEGKQKGEARWNLPFVSIHWRGSFWIGGSKWRAGVFVQSFGQYDASFVWLLETSSISLRKVDLRAKCIPREIWAADNLWKVQKYVSTSRGLPFFIADNGAKTVDQIEIWRERKGQGIIIANEQQITRFKKKEYYHGK